MRLIKRALSESPYGNAEAWARQAPETSTQCGNESVDEGSTPSHPLATEPCSTVSLPFPHAFPACLSTSVFANCLYRCQAQTPERENTVFLVDHCHPYQTMFNSRPAHWAKPTCTSALGTVALLCLVSSSQGIGSRDTNHGHLPAHHLPQEEVGSSLCCEQDKLGGAQLSVVCSASKTV